MSAEGSLVGKGALIGDTPTWFAFCVVFGITLLCFLIAQYTIRAGRE